MSTDATRHLDDNRRGTVYYKDSQIKWPGGAGNTAEPLNTMKEGHHVR